MADGIVIAVSQVTRAATDLGLMSAEAVRVIEPTMKRAAQEAKTDMQGIFGQSKHFGRIAATVSYDRIGFLSSIGYEIGPRAIDQGALAGIATEGGANGGGGTVDLQPVVDHIEQTLPHELEVALGML
ncbi:MAG: hypothetical protein QM628_00280 [Propionicimonas sp.]